MCERIRFPTFIKHAAKPVLIFLFVFITQPATAEGENNFRLRESELSKQISNIDDIRAEIEVGRNIGARLLAKFKLVDDKQLTRYINLVGQSLVLYSSRSELSFHFAVIDDNAINAYSTPGGYVFITRGALNLVSDESELASILAHEIAHISEKHIVREFNIRGKDDSAVSGITRVIGGSQDSTRVAFFQAVDKAMEILLDRGFKQEDEREADRVAIFLLAQTGYDVQALPRVLEKIKHNLETAPTKSPTHPTTDERIGTIATMIADEKLDASSFAKGKTRFMQNVK